MSPVWTHPKVAALAELLPGRDRALLDSLAGTGKTECVAQVALALVLEHGVAPHRIEILSFNEKAAREARERVREVAERLLQPPAADAQPGDAFTIDAPAREALRALLRRPPAVQTIHAWARELLGQEAFAAHAPLDQALVPRGEAFAAAFRLLVRERLATEDAADLTAWLEERSLARLESLLRRCAGEEPTTLLRPALDPDAARDALVALGDVPRRAWGRLRSAVDAHEFGRAHVTRRKLGEVLRELPQRIEAAAAGGGRLAPHGPHLAGDVRYVVEKLRRHGVEAPDAAPLPARLEGLARAQVSFDAAAANLWTGAARAAYERHKHALGGALDFDDLLRVLEEALAGPRGADLRARARARCDAVLIDEVQDANATIYGYAAADGAARGLFRPLFVDSAWPGRLVLAGDGHQSIYGWRGADVHGGFLTARRDIQAREGVVQLSHSYRSTPRFVAALNALFDQTAAPPFFQGEIDYAVPAQAGRPELRLVDAGGADAAPVRVLRLEPDPGGGKARVGEVRAVLARAIAVEIDRLCRTPAGRLRLTEPGREPRPLGLGDVFVLVRSHREAREVQHALAAIRPPIPAVLHKAGGVFAGPEAEDVADLLAGLAEPGRADRKARACLTPFFDVPLDRLSGLGDLPPGDALEVRWRTWSARAARDLPGLLATLVGESGLEARARFGGLAGERRIESYHHLLEVLASHQGRTGLDVGGLAAWLEQRRADAREDEHPVRQPGASEDAVRVMTVYAAKGLGAGVVFLTGGFTARDDEEGVKVYQAPAPAPASDSDSDSESEYPSYESPRHPPRYEVYHDAQGRRVLHVGPLDPESEPLYEASRREQDTFLLYTAITRGVGRVVLPFVPREGDDPEGAWLLPRLAGAYHEPLNEQLERLLAAREHDPALAALFEVAPVPLEELTPPPEPAAWARLADWAPPAELLAPPHDAHQARRALVARHRAQRVVSYSSLKRGDFGTSWVGRAATPELVRGDPGGRSPPGTHTDPGALLVDVPLPPPSAPVPGVSTEALAGGRHTGNLLHGAFEHVDLVTLAAADDAEAWGARPEVAALFAAQAERFGVPAEQLPVAREVVFHTLTRAIALAPGRVLDEGLCGAACLREPDFRVPLPHVADADLAPGVALRSGFVTGALDLLWREPGRVVGVDWKSDPLDDYGPAALHAKVAQDYPIQLAAYSWVLAKLAGIGDDPAPLDDGVEVVMAYVFVRATGLAGGAPEQGVRAYRLDAAGYRRIEAFLRGVVR